MSHRTAATALLLASSLPYSLALPQVVPFLSPLAPDATPIPLPNSVASNVSASDSSLVTVVGHIVSDAPKPVEVVSDAVKDLVPTDAPSIPDVDPPVIQVPDVEFPDIEDPPFEPIFDLPPSDPDVIDLPVPEVIDLPPPNTTFPVEIPTINTTLPVESIPAPNTTLPTDNTTTTTPIEDVTPPIIELPTPPENIPIDDFLDLPLPILLPPVDTSPIKPPPPPPSLPSFPASATVPIGTFNAVVQPLLSVIQTLIDTLPGNARPALPDIFPTPLVPSGPPDIFIDPIRPVEPEVPEPEVPEPVLPEPEGSEPELPEPEPELVDPVPAAETTAAPLVTRQAPAALEASKVFDLVAAIMQAINQLVGRVPVVGPVLGDAVKGVVEDVLPQLEELVTGEEAAEASEVPEVPVVSVEVPAVPEISAVPEVSEVPVVQVPTVTDIPTIPEISTPAVPEISNLPLETPTTPIDPTNPEAIDWSAWESPPIWFPPEDTDPTIPDDVLNVPVPELDDAGFPIDAPIAAIPAPVVPAVSVSSIAVPPAAPLPTSLDAFGDLDWLDFFDEPAGDVAAANAVEEPPVEAVSTVSEAVEATPVPLPEPVSVEFPDVPVEAVPFESDVLIGTPVPLPEPVSVEFPDVEEVPEAPVETIGDVVSVASELVDATPVPLPSPISVEFPDAGEVVEAPVESLADTASVASELIDATPVPLPSPISVEFPDAVDAPVEAPVNATAVALPSPIAVELPASVVDSLIPSDILGVPAPDVQASASAVVQIADPITVVSSVVEAVAEALPTSLDDLLSLPTAEELPDWPFADIPDDFPPSADGELPDLSDLPPIELPTARGEALALPIEASTLALPTAIITTFPTSLFDIPVPDDFEELPEEEPEIPAPTVVTALPAPVFDDLGDFGDIPADVLNIPWPDFDENGVPLDLPVAPSAFLAPPAALPTNLNFLDIPVPDDFVDVDDVPAPPAVLPAPPAALPTDLSFLDIPVPDDFVDVDDVPAPPAPTAVLPAPPAALPTDLNFLDIPVPDDFVDVDDVPAPPAPTAVVSDVVSDLPIPDDVLSIPSLGEEAPAANTPPPALPLAAFGAGFPVLIESDLPLVLPTTNILPAESAAGLTEALPAVPTAVVSDLLTAVTPAVPTLAIVLPYRSPEIPALPLPSVATVSVPAPAVPVLSSVPIVAAPAIPSLPVTLPRLPFQVPGTPRPVSRRQLATLLAQAEASDASDATTKSAQGLIRSVIDLLTTLLTKLGVEDQVPELDAVLTAIPAVPALPSILPAVPDVAPIVDAIDDALPGPDVSDIVEAVDALADALPGPDISEIVSVVDAVASSLPDVSDILAPVPLVLPVAPEVATVPAAVVESVVPVANATTLVAVVTPLPEVTAIAAPVVDEVPAVGTPAVEVPAVAVPEVAPEVPAVPVVDDLSTFEELPFSEPDILLPATFEELPFEVPDLAAIPSELPAVEEPAVAVPDVVDAVPAPPALPEAPVARRARRAARDFYQGSAGNWESFLGELDESHQPELAGLIQDSAKAVNNDALDSMTETLKADFDSLSDATKTQLANGLASGQLASTTLSKRAIRHSKRQRIPGTKSIGPNLDDARKVDLSSILGSKGSLDPFGQVSRPQSAPGKPVDSTSPFSSPEDVAQALADLPSPSTFTHSNNELAAIIAAGGLDPNNMRDPADSFVDDPAPQDPYADIRQPWDPALDASRPAQALEGLHETLQASQNNHLGNKGVSFPGPAAAAAMTPQQQQQQQQQQQRNLMIWFHRFVKPSWNKDVDAEIDIG